ncbi:family 20 glycosylhydrolase [Clostridium celatum]|uniref:family 20 glycosylhydrolase n=1 Tax=Clostridium celatum TaxID=36834 RepID=UPI00290E4021|nr:family 20 glycosylhydrolase [Clostridium celatum]MDU6295396.1 family 20 glycosylhydrolase [Clostridium celatum]
MITRKYGYKGDWKKTLSAIMTLTVLCSTTISALEIDNAYGENKVVFTNEELSAMVNPIVQSYTADASMKTWSLTADSRLVVLANETNVNNERLKEVIKLVNAEFLEKEIVSAPLVMAYGGESELVKSDVFINITDVSEITEESTSLEAYRIDIDDNGIRLTGASENAILYGLRTIQNLMITNEGLVYGTIIDYPDVEERRIHVDCGRKYFSKDWFIRQIREMSYMKMNTIQMHFSENMGFRIECETDPSIVSDEYLTKKEVREILEEARKYGIKVIPSFDTPGHANHILKFHPEYGQISNTGTHFDGGLDVTNPEAVEYFKSLYREYMELFEGCTDFHIGGDEYMEFDRAPFTTQYKSVLDSYAKDKFGSNAVWQDALANYINEIAELVYEGGFKPRVWNDGLYYGENSYNEKPQTVKMHDYIGVDFWSQMGWNRDIANLNTIINKGHTDIYNVNAGYFYYVLRNSKPTDGREQHSFDYLNQDVRIFEQWTPGKFESNTISDDSSVIKGASLAVWCDNPNLVSEDIITEDISKELRSLATKSWNTKSNSITTIDKFRENYALLGNVAGFEKGSQLPEVGEFLEAENIGKVTLRYVSNTGKILKDDIVKYGTIGKDYSFDAEEIYGYRVISEENVSGNFSKEEVVYTFTYELYCNKSELEKEIKNPLNESLYIRETFADYKNALENAKSVYENELSEQLEVDEVLTELLAAKEKSILLECYPLYVECEYTLNSEGFISGYEDYIAAINNGKAILYSEDISTAKMREEFEKIQVAKSNLMKKDGNTPDITSSDTTYTHSGASWQGPYFPPEKFAVERMVDGDLSTKAWFADNQNIGDEILFSFPQELNMSKIQIIQPEEVGEDMISKADVEVKSANGDWIKVGELSSSEGRDKTIYFDETLVQYVRIVIKEDLSKWYQIAEVYFTYEQIQESNVLRDMILEAEKLNIESKNKSLISNMVDALIEAQKAYIKNSIDTEDIESKLRKAIDAIDNEIEEIFTEHLKLAVEEAKNITEDELLNIVPAVVSEFKEALKEAEELLALSNVTQEQINNSFDRLSKVMQMLSFEKGNKETLISLIDRIEKLNEKEYISETWSKLQEKLSFAISVVKDENVLKDDVMKSYEELLRSFLELRLKPSKDKLQELISKAEKIDKNRYTENSLKVLDKALEKARGVFSNEESIEKEILEANKNLELALNNLVEKESSNINNSESENNSNSITENNVNNNINKNENIIASTTSKGNTSNTISKGNKLPNTGGRSNVAALLFASTITVIGSLIAKKKR